MGNLAAINQKRYRDRLREDRVVLRVEVDHPKLVEKLVETGRLAASDIWRRDRVEEALSLAVAGWIIEDVT